MTLKENITLVCEGCRTSFRIPEGKIPQGKTVAVSCPKCQHRFSFTAPNAGIPGIAVPSAEARHEGASQAFFEEEGECALVCVEDPALQMAIRKTLEGMKYQVVIAGAAHEALKTMRMQTCHLVVACESFGGVSAERNSVLLYLERLPMAIRREMFVVMVSQGHGTLDSLGAFLRSVNLIVNVRHVSDLGRLLKQGLADKKYVYEIFLESMDEQERR